MIHGRKMGDKGFIKVKEMHGRRSCYKIIVVVLFASSITLLSVTQKFKVLDNREGSIVDEKVTDTSSQLSKLKNPLETKHLPEDDPHFQAPNPHARYVIAIGRGNSLQLVSSRKQMGVDSPEIILWNGQEHSMNDAKKDFEFVLSQKCGGCHVTRDRSYVDDSAAIVFFNDIGLFKETPPDQRKRKPGQVYVFWSRETQAKTVGHRSKLENSAFDGIFNLTLFFRRDADIIQYFGNRESALRLSKTTERKISRRKFLESKTKVALWLVSNCDHTYGAVKRLMYAKQLVQEGLELDKFGKCFSGSERFDSKDVDGSQYRFYLSFENSIHCADYITEKFWRNSLQSGLVPIVFGPVKEDVQAVAPPNSYIFAENFKSPHDLVEYLNYLTRNNTAYMEYHRWRDQEIDENITEEDIAKGPQASFCRLCKRLTQRSVSNKSIPSVAKWMYDKRYIDDQCYKHKMTAKELRKYGSIQSLTNF